MDSQSATALLDGTQTNAPASSLAPLSGQALQATLHATPAAPVSDETSVLAPLNPIGSASETGDKNIADARQAFSEANTQPGTELDTTTGADSWTRAMLSFRRAQEDQVAYLQKKYGEANVRTATDGTPIVRIIDSHTGKPKDLLVKEEGMSAKDLLDLTGQIPELAGSIIGMRYGGTKALGFLPKLRNLIAMAVGGEGAGAIKDMATRAVDSQPIRPGEIATSRAEMAGLDMTMGTLLGASGKASSKLASPLATGSASSTDMRAAATYLGEKLAPGYKLPMTIGESTGNPLMQRIEAQIGQKPGSSLKYDAIRKQQNAALVKIQNAALGVPLEATPADIAALPTAEQTGTKAMQEVESKVAPLQGAAETASQDLAQTGSKEIKAAVGAGTPTDVPSLGQKLRAVALDKRAQFEARSAEDYGKVYAHPQASSYVLSSDKLASDATTLLKSLPAPETITETPTGLLDKFGNEILRDESGRKIMRNFVPPNVLTKLNDLAALKGGKFRLGDLLKMRTDVANDIAQGEAIPGMNTHYLSQIRGMLTDTINSELDKLPDNSLKTLWKAANDNYAAGVKQFTKSGVSELFRTPEQGSYLGDSEVVKRALSGPNAGDQFRAYREFYSASSPEYKGLKQAVVDDLIGRSSEVRVRTAGSPSALVDADKFVSNLVNLQVNHPDIAKEILGDTQPLINKGLLMSAGGGDIGKLAERFQGKVSESDLKALIRSGDLTATRLGALLDKENQLNTIYQNKIIRQIATGKFTGDKIDPSEFASRFASAEPKDIHQVMAMLSDRPEILQEIKSATVQDVISKATIGKGQTAGQLLKGLPGELSSSGLINALGDATQKQRFQAILGADTYRDLEEMAKFLGPREKAQQAYKSAAGLQVGAQIAGLERGGVFKFMGQALRGFVIGEVLNTTPLRQWLSNVAVKPETSSAVANTMIASTPFVESLYRTYGPEEGARKAAELRAAIQKSAKASGQTLPDQTGKTDNRSQEFDRLLDGKKN